MNRVLGSSIKAAVAIAVNKQIAAAGIEGTLTTTRWQGKTAYAAWRMDDDSVWNKTRNVVINYPNLSDDALLTRAEADLIAAFTLHETGHVTYTKRVGLHGDLHAVWNGIEDGWMENKVIQAGIARNAKQLFVRLLNKLTADCGPTFNPCNWSDSPFALALLTRAAFGNGNAFANSLLDRIPEPKRALYRRVMERVTQSNGSITNAEIAIEFAEAFKQIDAEKERVKSAPPPAPPAPPADDYWQDDGQEETVAEDAPLKDPEAIAEPADDGAKPADDGFGDDDLEPADDGADGDDGDDDGLDDDRDGDLGLGDDDLEDDLDDAAGSGPADEPTDEDGDEPTDEDGDEEIGGASGGDGETFSDDNGTDDKQCRSPEPSIDDVVNRAHKRTKEKSALPPYSPARRITPQTSRECDPSFGPTPGALRTSLTRLLTSVDRIGWDVGATSGRFDIRRTSRMMAGSERVFKKRWETEAVNSRVTVLIDLSSSMGWGGGERAALSSDVAFAIADVCERTSTAVEVVGFVDSHAGGMKTFLPGLDGSPVKTGASWDDADLVEFKRFDQRVRDARTSIFKARHATRGATPDAHALRTCVEQMGLETEARRIVIVLTDGFGDPYRVRQVCDVASKRGCKVLGIGILTDPEEMAKSYPVSACASSLDELATVALRSLIKQVG